MKKSVQISIPSPCHENWQNMTPVEKGRFCSACQKNVVDFTMASDAEIFSAFSKNGDICGRFNLWQLNRDLTVRKEKSGLWMAAAGGIFAFLGLGNQTSSAQHKAKLELGKGAAAGHHLRTISGFVLYDGLPLENVSVSVLDKKIETVTDAHGAFILKAKTGDKICFTAPAMKAIEMTVNENSTYSIEMEIDPANEAVVVNSYRIVSRTMSGGAIMISSQQIEERRHRTFLGRIFHSIGSLFK